jgi:hypothetical protein
MKIGFIVECTQEVPEESVLKAVMRTFRPRDEHLVSPMIDKGKLLEAAPAEVRKLASRGLLESIRPLGLAPSRSALDRSR